MSLINRFASRFSTFRSVVGNQALIQGKSATTTPTTTQQDTSTIAKQTSGLASSTQTSTTQATASTAAATTNNSTAGSSASNPYVLTPGKNNWVPFTDATRPKYISYNGNVYKENGHDSDGTPRYLAVNEKNLPTGKKRLYIDFLKGTKTVQTGTKTEQVQVGTQKVQIGTEKVQTGTKQVQTGTEQVQVGTEKVQTGTEKVQTGTKQVQTGTEQVQVGTEKVQTGTRVVGTETHTEQKTIQISRELDGKNDTGAVGDMLTRGTTQLSDAQQFFDGNSFDKYQVSGLTAENNQAVSTSTNPITQRQGADDMYVAGDPQVGGKGNAYNAVNVTPDEGYLTMFEDGTDTSRKVTVNAHAEIINDQGNKAFTEYGFVVQDDAGQKTTAALSGGKLNITGADGQTKVLQPGETYVVGSATDPVAKFYYASVPGGENGTNEQRVVFESYEKPSDATVSSLVAEGMSQTEAAALRNKTSMTFGFRVPDGEGSYRLSSGIAANSPAMNTTSNNVKTYYDAHFYEAPEVQKTFNKVTECPITEPVYEDKPIYETKPVYEECPIYEDKPVYTDKPIYETKPVYEECPIYEEKPVYKETPVYQTKETPIYGKLYEIRNTLASPLVMDLDGGGIETTDTSQKVDIDGDGSIDNTSWFGAKEGVLAFDADKSGKIDLNGRELFGDNSDVDGDGQSDGFANGFEALRALANQTLGTDSTADNVLDSDEIAALQDQAGLRMVVNDQVKNLSDLGVNKINLGYSEDNVTIDQYGNEFRQQGSFERTLDSGETVKRDLTDVWLVKNPTNGTSTGSNVTSSATPSTSPFKAANIANTLPLFSTAYSARTSPWHNQVNASQQALPYTPQASINNDIANNALQNNTKALMDQLFQLFQYYYQK